MEQRDSLEKRPTFSVIVPVYNRPGEVADLLESLAQQSDSDFETVIVEDGSTEPCKSVVEKYANSLDIKYIFKENEGRSIARNVGIEASRGEWLVFFDSDCVVPSSYFAAVKRDLRKHPDVDCYGGPDAAHASFTTTQKAINHAMTSFLTTGGIRGGKVQLEKFVPRTFNMGFRREIYDRIGGFREMFSEDIDMSTRIGRAGYRISLFRDVYVWHKRRVDFRRFLRQVWVFGMSRITLQQLYPGSLKAVHALPAIALIIGLTLVVLGIVLSPWWLLPIGAYLLAIFVSALVATRSLVIACKALPASVIQIGGYGWGFLQAWFSTYILGRGRDVNREISMRKGK